MADLVEIKLSKFDNQPWGFRLTGGKDFGLPLTILRVVGGGLAEQAGLQAGDILVQINGQPTSNLTHKGAQDAILSAGNNFITSVIRGGSQPTPFSQTLPRAAKPKAPVPGAIEQRPLTPVVPSSLGPASVLSPQATILGTSSATDVQANGLTEEDIAETMISQTEVLSNQSLGVNFKKFEPKYEFLQKSSVFRMLHGIPDDDAPPTGRLGAMGQKQQQQILIQQQKQEQQLLAQKQQQQQQLLQQQQIQEQQLLLEQQEQQQHIREQQLFQQPQQQQQQLTQQQLEKKEKLKRKENAVQKLSKFVKRPIVAPRIRDDDDEIIGPSYPAGISYRPSYPLTPAAKLVRPAPPPPPPPPAPPVEELPPVPPKEPTPPPPPPQPPKPTGPMKPVARPAAVTNYRPTEWKRGHTLQKTKLTQSFPPPQPVSLPKPKPMPQAAPKPKPQPRPQPVPQPKPQPTAQPKPQAAVQPKPQPPPQPKPQFVPQPTLQQQPLPKTQPKAGPAPSPATELYNEEAIAETMLSQTELVKGQALGVNFKKFDRGYDHLQNSAVFRMIHGLEESPESRVARLPERVESSDHYKTVCFNQILQNTLKAPTKSRPGSVNTENKPSD